MIIHASLEVLWAVGSNEWRESDLFLVMVEGVGNVCLMMDHLHSFLTRSLDSDFVLCS